MISSWSRRAVLALACVGGGALLAACGSGSVVSDLAPKRFITVGDSFSDVGQVGGVRYTVNDGSKNWVQELAGHYDQTVTAASAGGWGYAQGHARVNAVDAIGGAPSVKQQIDTVLARTTLHPTEDVVVINGGMHDIVAAVNATGISADTTKAVEEAGKALAEQVHRVVNAGGKHVLVVGVYSLGVTPWARNLNQSDAITTLALKFNEALNIGIVSLGANVLSADPALLHNLMYNKPGNYRLDNGRDPVCTTPDASTCTPSTIVAGANYDRWLYSDALHFTPQVLREFGDDRYTESVYYKVKNRW